MATQGRFCVIVISKPVFGITTSSAVLASGLSITKLPSAESSVNGKLFGSGARFVNA